MRSTRASRAKDHDDDGGLSRICSGAGGRRGLAGVVFLPSMEASWFRQLKASLDAHGLERVYAWGHPMGLEDGTNRGALEDMIAQIDNAERIGARVMRVVPGPGPGDYRYLPRQPRLDVLAGLVQRGCPRRRTSRGQAGGGEPRRLHRP